MIKLIILVYLIFVFLNIATFSIPLIKKYCIGLTLKKEYILDLIFAILVPFPLNLNLCNFIISRVDNFVYLDVLKRFNIRKYSFLDKLDKHYNDLPWGTISEYQNLPFKIAKKYKDKINWEILIKNYRGQ
jgi:hypothetical protein